MERQTVTTSLLLAGLLLFVIGAAAQHAQHHPAQATTNEHKAHSMMSGGMMGHHQEMEKLVGQIVRSFSALEREENPAAMEKRMAEHGALLEQLQSQVRQRSEMMRKMTDHMENCPMMSQDPSWD